MNNKPSKNIPAHISAIITIFIWGMTFVSTKILLKDFYPVEILFLRFLIGFFVLFLICPGGIKINGFKKELLFIFAGFFGITLYYLFENIALCFTYAANVGVIMSCAPFAVGILSYFVFRKKNREKLYLNFFLGFLTAIIGIYLISFKNTKIEINPLGDFLAICASFIWAIYSILIKKISNYGYSTIQVTKRIFFHGIILMIPFLIYFEKIQGNNLNFETFLNPVNFLNLLYLSLGASAFCFIWWNYSLKKLGAVKTSIYIYLVPVICAVSSVLILGEKLDVFSISGIILVIFGLILSNFKKPEKL